MPFSCDPLPNAFFFPAPGPGDRGTYARCASFAEAQAASLDVSPDGSRIALVGADGIVRIVEVSSHMVIGVLAPPRASITRAAFSPTGQTLVTLAKGERVVTAWDAVTFQPLWSTTLPGHTYYPLTSGSLSVSPDGSTAVVSPGDDLFRLALATGEIQASRVATSFLQTVLAVTYGWNGQRVVVQQAPVAGMCAQGAVGGTVTILDPSHAGYAGDPDDLAAVERRGAAPRTAGGRCRRRSHADDRHGQRSNAPRLSDQRWRAPRDAVAGTISAAART